MNNIPAIELLRETWKALDAWATERNPTLEEIADLRERMKAIVNQADQATMTCPVCFNEYCKHDNPDEYQRVLANSTTWPAEKAELEQDRKELREEIESLTCALREINSISGRHI